MTRKEFLTGVPFTMPQVNGQFKYNEQEGGELEQLVNGSWQLALIVESIGDKQFKLYSVKRNNEVFRNHSFKYEDCTTLTEML